MPQEVRLRKQKNVQYDENNTVSEDLSRGMVYRELMIRLKGQITLTAANNTQAKLKRGDEWAIIKAIKIVANHVDVIKHIKGADLYWLNYFWYGMAPDVNATLGDGSTANPSFDSTLILPFWQPRTAKPIDTALDARELSGLQVEIEWGSETDVNGDASGWTANPSVQVYSMESFNVKGPFSQWRIHPIEHEITSDNPEFQVLLPVSYMYRGFTIFATDGGAASGDIINNAKLVSGTTVYENLQADVLQALYRIRYGCESGVERRSNSDDVAGAYRLDHVTDGYMTEAIDTLGFSEFNLELDVSVGSGTTKIFVYPDQIVPVRGRQG